MSNIIKETPNYKMVADRTTHYAKDNPDLVIYKIINKEYGVVETEVSVLSHAIAQMHKFQAELDLALEAEAELTDEETYLEMTESEAVTLN